MRRLATGLFVCALIQCGCAGRKDLAGRYVEWMFFEGSFIPSDGSQGTKTTLTLRQGGTYTLEIETSVMMRASMKAEGEFTQSGTEVTLSGTMAGTVDDGYRKETQSTPHRMTLRVESDMLVTRDGKGDPVYFRREGTGPPPLPAKLKLTSSDPATLKLLEKTEKYYASLKTYRDSGRVISGGAGFVAKDATFRTLFQRPSKLRFEAVIWDSGSKVEEVQVTWDGGRTCWWYTTEFGETRERPLDNALSIASVSFGDEADFVPSLLLPKIFRGGGLAENYPEVSLLPEESVGGRPCSVLQLKDKGTKATKLWIDKASGLIVQMHEEVRGVTVSYRPEANGKVSTGEFRMGQRSQAELGRG